MTGSQFVSLGDEAIDFSLVERGRSLTNPQPHPLLHFLVRMKPTDTNVFLQVAQNVEATRAKTWVVRRMLKCFPATSLKLIPHQIGSMGTGVIMQKDDSVRQLSRAFWLYGASHHSVTKKGTTPTSLLFFLCLHFQCWTNTLYTMLTSRAVKKLCGPLRFHFACLVPYRRKYRYVTAVLPAFARNVF